MASGCPVVASKYAALPETAGGAALLVDPLDASQIASALKTVLTDGKLRNELIERGLERAKSFSLEKWGQETLKIYEKVLNNT